MFGRQGTIILSRLYKKRHRKVSYAIHNRRKHYMVTSYGSVSGAAY